MIAFIIGAILAFIPLALAAFKIPSNTVIGANNSAVISAACHSIPAESVEMTDAISSRERLLELAETGETTDADAARTMQILYSISTQELKWGMISRTSGRADDSGHLAFGTMDQEVRPPVDGDWHAGS